MSSFSVSLSSILDNKPLDIALKTLIYQLHRRIGGEGGIRTHGRRKPTTVFETATIDHSVTSPRFRGRLWGGWIAGPWVMRKGKSAEIGTVPQLHHGQLHVRRLARRGQAITSRGTAFRKAPS